MIITGRSDSYKGFIKNKKIYLKRKKQLNKEIKHFKKCYRKCKVKAIGRRYFRKIINKGKDDIYLLRIMWNLKKFNYRRLKRG